MLNILIALVSKAYEDVMEKKRQANDYERANLISSLDGLLKPAMKSKCLEYILSKDRFMPQDYLIKVELKSFKEKELDPKERHEETLKTIKKMEASNDERFTNLDLAIKDIKELKV